VSATQIFARLYEKQRMPLNRSISKMFHIYNAPREARLTTSYMIEHFQNHHVSAPPPSMLHL